MKILILGGTGMLGHTLAKNLAARHTVLAIDRVVADVRHPSEVARFLGKFAPEVVINCVGITNHRTSSPAEMIHVNALFPHILAAMCQNNNARLIHFSTDCVFSGKRGWYTEDDTPDPVDMYGRTKVLGEVDAPNVITLRTSIIGRELGTQRGLLEWFLAQTGPVPGYTGALFTGLTTLAMARVVEHVLARPDLSGVWHVGGHGISKYDLLKKLQKHYQTDAVVLPGDSVQCDRRLSSLRFAEAFDYKAPTWTQMIEELT